MAYDENKVTKLSALKNLSERAIETFATQTDLDVTNGDVSALQEDVSTVQDNITSVADSVTIITGYDNAGNHNSIFRGKYLGDAVTSEQAERISDGTFTDLYVGDYWTINDVNWRIAGFDYLYKCGSTSMAKHHAVIVPDTVLYVAPMNSTSVTTGAYVGSAMFTCEDCTVSDVTYNGLANAITMIESAFGDYVLPHYAYLANAVTSGYPSAQAWYADRLCDLMTEQMVWGSAIVQQMSYGGNAVANRRIEKFQLPLFALDPRFINIRASYWVYDVATDSGFVYATASGLVSFSTANAAQGVRPYFLIGC